MFYSLRNESKEIRHIGGALTRARVLYDNDRHHTHTHAPAHRCDSARKKHFFSLSIVLFLFFRRRRRISETQNRKRTKKTD